MNYEFTALPLCYRRNIDIIQPFLLCVNGESYEDRTHTSGITTRGADHYTNDSIGEKAAWTKTLSHYMGTWLYRLTITDRRLLCRRLP